MKKTGLLYSFSFSFFCLLFSVIPWPREGWAQTEHFDAPHNVYTNNVVCESCHLARSVSGSGAPFWFEEALDIDDTVQNKLCWYCHNGITAPFKETHTSAVLGSKYATTANPNYRVTDPFGSPIGWSVDCIECHWRRGDSHGMHNPISAPGGALVTGTYVVDLFDAPSSSTTLTLTEGANTGRSLEGNDWSGYILVIDWTGFAGVDRKTFRILRVRDTGGADGKIEVVVQGDARGAPEDTYRIVYGRYLNQWVEGGVTGVSVVLDRVGGDSFLGDQADTSDGFCEGCHTVAGQGAHPQDQWGNDCTLCHAVREGFFPYGCNGCHGAGQQFGAPYVAGEQVGDQSSHPPTGEPLGAHALHVPLAGGDSESTCNVCHNGHGMPSVDKTLTIGFTGIAGAGASFDAPASMPNGYSFTGDVTFGGTRTCSGVYCHDPSGSGALSPSWDGALPDRPECDSCHGGNRDATATAGLGPMSSGRHTAHVNNADAGLGSFPCGRCHADTVTAGDDRTITGAAHANGSIDVVFDGLNPGASDCDSLYCHSDGKGTSVPPPAWTGGAGLGCNGCHGVGTASGYPNYPNEGPGAPFANDHDTHSEASNCFYCHYGTTIDGYSIAPGSTEHVNGALNVDVNPVFNGVCSDAAYTNQYDCETNGAVWTGGTFVYNGAPGQKTCTGVVCHTTLVQWGDDPANVTAHCGVCHETPPLDDVGDTQPHTIHYGIGNEGVVPDRYGDRHVEASRTAYGFYCAFCHPRNPLSHQDAPEAGTTADPKHMEIELEAWDEEGNLIPGGGPLARNGVPTYDETAATEYVDPGVAKYADGTPVFYYGYHDGQCTNIYCHSDARGGDPLHTPRWQIGDAPADCTYCHPNDAAAAVTMSTGSHTTHLVTAGKGCVECHSLTVSDNRTIADRRRHVSNHFLSPGTCSDPAYTVRADCLDAGEAWTPLEGLCSDPVYTDKSSCTGAGGTWTAAGDPDPNARIDVAWGPLSAGGDPFETAGAATCSNLYCHGNFAGSGRNDPVVWGDPASSGCGTCHGATAGDPPDGGSHRGHVTVMNFPCSMCHNDTAAGFDLNDRGFHVNGSTDWHLDGSDPRVAGGSYSSSPVGAKTPPDTNYGSCSGIYCHSSAQGVNDPADPPEYSAPVWGDPASGACGTCHKTGAHTANGYSQSLANPMVTGGHGAHVGAYVFDDVQNPSCQICHYVDPGANCSNPCHSVTFEKRRTVDHVNGQINVQFDLSFVGASAAYSGDSTPGTAYGQCSDVYCHSIGDLAVTAAQRSGLADGGLYAPAVTWGGASLGCNGCHGRNGSTGAPDYANDGPGSPTANTHATHVESSPFGCGECHYRTTRDGLTINPNDDDGDSLPDGFAYHVNGVNTDVFFDPARNPSATYDAATRTCSTLSCHGGASAVWGDTVAFECLDCHANPVGGRRGSDFGRTSHHITSVAPTSDQCRVCHDTSAHGSGTVRLLDGDSGAVIAYDPASPATAEPFCLSCHDSDGASRLGADAMSPFQDGSTLGANPYRAGVDIAADWAQPYGHAKKGLTCLGDGTPNTGCHANGHGSDYVGLLANQMGLPASLDTYVESEYKLCFDCHSAYPVITKDSILGVEQGSAYDGAYGPGSSYPPYYTSGLITKFADRNAQGSGKPYDDPSNFWLSGYDNVNLHVVHIAWDVWDYRGVYRSGMSCQACHSVHGTSSPVGMTYASMDFQHFTVPQGGSLPDDKYGKLGPAATNPYTMDRYPTYCYMNCHSAAAWGETSSWYYPPTR